MSTIHSGDSFKHDPARLRDYVDSLKMHCGFWVDSVDGLADYMNRLGQTWQDDQFDEFKGEVETLRTELGKYTTIVAIMIKKLEDDAQALEHYQNIQL